MWYKIKVEEIHSGIVWVEGEDEQDAYMKAVGRVEVDFDRIDDYYVIDLSKEKPEEAEG